MSLFVAVIFVGRPWFICCCNVRKLSTIWTRCKRVHISVVYNAVNVYQSKRVLDMSNLDIRHVFYPCYVELVFTPVHCGKNAARCKQLQRYRFFVFPVSAINMLLCATVIDSVIGINLEVSLVFVVQLIWIHKWFITLFYVCDYAEKVQVGSRNWQSNSKLRRRHDQPSGSFSCSLYRNSNDIILLLM